MTIRTTDASICMNRSMAKDATKKTHGHELELEIPDEYEETQQRPEGCLSRRETLCRKAEQEDGPVPIRTKFQEMLKNPDALYEDIIELIKKSRDFRVYRDNYRKQLIEVKQTMQHSGTISGTLVLFKGQRFMKLPDPLLFDGSTKDRVMNISLRDLKDDLNDKLTWKLQEAVAMYYNDSTVTLSQFAKHCTTND
ncbi:hypothetical protein GP486_003292 [Trichoglossum hirsutum]|uniref:Uncharacterized protein n=1 Tax=Trichoglossum hirsutum TaxID=265104 RepID=A0A9P8RQV3_9PEZI|nr:hypothetical protein GP486_003292 [Trichoglossum hirsutum]